MSCISKALTFISFSLLLLLFACQKNAPKEINNEENLNTTNQIVNDNFQSVIDSNNLIGSIIIYDSKLNQYHSNDFERGNTGFLPASTFKIVNSIIGLETNVLSDENHFFKWDGEPRRLKAWETDLNLTEAYKCSCVPCYQSVAREIGIDSMNYYLQKLEYGNQIIPDSLIDLFWLVGNFQISQIQQLNFLQRLQEQKLDISEKTYAVMKKIMLIDKKENYTLSGKTGWAIREGNNIGWFVGFIETNDNIYYLATNVTPKNEVGLASFAKNRLQITLEAYRTLSK